MSRNYQGGGGSNEINFASYGGVKKCLGTRPGPASGFKPPVKQVNKHILSLVVDNLIEEQHRAFNSIPDISE